MAREIVDLENQIVDAGDDDDTLLVYARGAVVHGGAGSDWLGAILDIEAAGEDSDGDGIPNSGAEDNVTTELHGDAGNDLIHASLRLVNPSPYDLSAKITATLLGGEGSDQLWLDIRSVSAGFEAIIDGGAGEDEIRVSALGSGDGYSSSGPITVDAGAGDDAVSIHSTGRADYGDVTVSAGSGNDFIESYTSNITIEGYAWGANYFDGGNGDDTLIGTAATRNEASGGSGSDRITLNSSFNTASGGSGDDWVKVVSKDGDIDAAVFGDNVVTGGTGNDTVEAVLDFDYEGYGANKIHGDEGDDRITGTVILGDGTVSDAHSELYGGEGNDRLKVSGGTENFLTGNQGNDTLLGSTGADRMIGGQGDDYLKGYAGDDTFEFQSARNGERDRIDGFDIGSDVIDVSRIDANAFRGGNQSFTFDASDDGGTGKIWVEDYGTRSIVHADTGRAILDIVLLDGRGVDAGDYGASDFIL